MQTANQKQLCYQVYCPRLPLAIYREIAVHLRQVEGVNTQLNPPSSSSASHSAEFDYLQSQVGSLSIQYHEDVDPNIRQRVDRILAYYSDRYGHWQSM